MNRSILPFIFLLITFSAFAQPGDNISFTHIHEGLPQKTISVIVQDKYGFIWFGTRYGLTKYDGNKFYTFRSDANDSTSIASNVIRDVVMDKKGNFWIVADAIGLDYFDYKKGTFTHFKHNPNDPNSLSEDYTNSLFIDHMGKLWIGTESGGLNMYDPETKTFTRFYHNADDPFSISHNQVSDIEEDDLGNLWITTQGGGLNLYDRNSKRFIRYKAETSGLTTNALFRLYKGEDNMWIGSNQGVFSLTYNPNGSFSIDRLEANQQDYINHVNSVSILAILEDRFQNVWIGTENGGLYIYNKKTKDLQHFTREVYAEHSLASNSIWSLFADRSDNIWIGTFENGISEYNQYQNKFRHIEPSHSQGYGLSYNSVSSFEQDRDGNLWVATDGGGLNFINEKTGEFTYFQHEENRRSSLASNAVLDLLIDKDENLWVASWQGGFSKKVKGKDEFVRYHFFEEDDLESLCNYAFYLLEDSNERIWVSFFRKGIGIFDKKTKTFIRLLPNDEDPLSISSNTNRVIYEEKPGVFLLGTENKGIDRIVVDEQYKIVEKKTYRFDPNDTTCISQNTIMAIHPKDSANLWIGTFGGGINIYNKKDNSFRYLTEEDGLPSNVIFAIQTDHHGDSWISTSKGLVRMNKNKDIEVFGVKDGLQDEEYVKNSSFITPEGELLFGGINGFNRFFPHEIKRNTEIPNVYITGFQVFDKPEYTFKNGQVIDDVFPSGAIDLAHDENDFEFDVSVLNYSQSSKNKIAYMLYPYQDDWEYINPNDRISFTNVTPGEYEFRVKGSNNDGIWNEQGAKIKINISKPWWASYFAYFIYALMIICLLIWLREITLVRERLKNTIKLEHLELKKLHELDEIKSRFFANISHEFRTPLTLILGPLKSLVSSNYKGDPKSQYRIMLRNAEKLLRLINQLLELSKLESGSMKLKASQHDVVKFLKPIVHSFTSYAERQVIDYKCEFPNEPILLYFERDKLEKIVVNLLSNAIKYTPEFGKVIFRLYKERNYLLIEVQDTGIGIPQSQVSYVFDRFYQVEGKKQQGTGIGLALTKELVELHKGKISLESQEGNGTIFTVKLKLGRIHLSDDEITTQSDAAYDSNPHSRSELDAMNPSSIHQKIDDNPEDEAADDIPTILLAEDNEDMRLYIGEFLDTKYRLIEAKNGAEAIGLSKKHVPDVIITDVMMPEKDGYEVVEEVKADEKTSHIPIIMLTAKASPDSALQGFETGADYYVTKPFNPKLLELRINNILKTKEKFRERLLSGKAPDLSPKEIKIASKDQALIKKLMQCIEDNMSNSDFTVDHICKELGMSRTQLYRKIKGLVGQTANEFIRSMRLKRAAQLIKQNEMTIAEVTYRVGFNDLQYFRFCFKKQFGVNPSEYLQKVS